MDEYKIYSVVGAAMICYLYCTTIQDEIHKLAVTWLKDKVESSDLIIVIKNNALLTIINGSKEKK